MTKTALILDEFIPYRLSFTSNLVSEVIARAYQTLFGLRVPEWRLVAVIAETEAVTQQAIGARTRMDKVTVSRAAIALVERGLVLRRPNPADRRSHLLVLSRRGRELFDEVMPKAMQLEAQIFSGFEAAELARFIDLLRRIDLAALAAI
jgi:DNA-binding MarR family transcriptional regulator